MVDLVVCVQGEGRDGGEQWRRCLEAPVGLSIPGLSMQIELCRVSCLI
jgi:hypothetical protein